MNQPTSDERNATPYALAVFGVIFASICFGLVPYFSRGLTDQGLAPYAVAFYRYIFAAIFLLPALLMHRSKWREILWGMVAGSVRMEVISFVFILSLKIGPSWLKPVHQKSRRGPSPALFLATK